MDITEDYNELGGARRMQANPASNQAQGPAPKPTLRVIKRLQGTLEAGTNSSVSLSAQLEKNITEVESVAIVIKDESKLNNLDCELRISETEILPANTAAQLIYAYPSVAVSDRYLVIKADPGNGTVSAKVSYEGTLSGALGVELYLVLKKTI